MLSETKDNINHDVSVAEALAEKFVEGKEIWKYKKVVDASPTEMAISNSMGSLIYCNKSYLKLVGCDSVEEVIGDGWQKVISNEDKERVLGGFAYFILKKIEKFWGFVKYQNIKTGQTIRKKVVCSRIELNGYGIYLMPENFETDPDFIEAIFP